MSPKNPPLIVGLAAPGLLWLATSVALGQEPPPAAPPTPTPTPKLAPTPVSPGSTAYKALLLTNGKVVRGEIVEDAAAKLYRLRQRGGSIGYPKIMVAKAGESLEELYRFQVARLPEGDPDERMKLARWCLTEKLPAQAREQLEAVQAMCPDDAEAKGMLYNLAATAEAKPAVDPDLRRTSGEMADASGAAPDSREVAGVRRRFNNALPEIFDLPRAQAVKRANEFVEHVQPVLQQRCARCHDEKYDGEFQLVEVRPRRDWTNGDIARANLDATLRLVIPDDPARSPLLMAGLMPHAGAKGTIFRGPNDPAYQALAAWAKSLRPATKGPNGAPSPPRALGDGQSRATATAPGEGFASERPGRPGPTDRRGPSPLPILPSSEKDDGMPAPLPPSRAIVEQIDESAEFVSNPADRPEFPAPFAFGGKPAPAKPPAKTKPAAPGSPPTAKPPAKTATPAGPGSVTVSTDDPNELPGMDLPRYPPKPDGDDPASKAKPKAKAKPIDPALLEKMMKSRNGGTP